MVCICEMLANYSWQSRNAYTQRAPAEQGHGAGCLTPHAGLESYFYYFSMFELHVFSFPKIFTEGLLYCLHRFRCLGIGFVKDSSLVRLPGSVHKADSDQLKCKFYRQELKGSGTGLFTTLID